MAKVNPESIITKHLKSISNMTLGLYCLNSPTIPTLKNLNTSVNIRQTIMISIAIIAGISIGRNPESRSSKRIPVSLNSMTIPRTDISRMRIKTFE